MGAEAWVHGHCCNMRVMSNGLNARSLLHPSPLHIIAGREVGNNQIVTTSLLAKCPPSPIVCPPVPSTFQHFSHNLWQFPINHGHTDPQYLPLGRRACLHHCVVILTIGRVDKAFCVDRGSIRVGLSKVMKDFPRGSDWFGLAHMVASLHTMREYILYWHYSNKQHGNFSERPRDLHYLASAMSHHMIYCRGSHDITWSTVGITWHHMIHCRHHMIHCRHHMTSHDPLQASHDITWSTAGGSEVTWHHMINCLVANAWWWNVLLQLSSWHANTVYPTTTD